MASAPPPPPSYDQSQTSQPQTYPPPPQPTSIGYDQQPPTYSAQNYATQYSQKPAPYPNQQVNVTSPYPTQVGAQYPQAGYPQQGFVPAQQGYGVPANQGYGGATVVIPQPQSYQQVPASNTVVVSVSLFCFLFSIQFVTYMCLIKIKLKYLKFKI